jgi:FtsP/CotA-like multicopper oxidase with cupredoxin domain
MVSEAILGYDLHKHDLTNVLQANIQVSSAGHLYTNHVLNTTGPTIVADWGDRINITVINNLRTNGYVCDRCSVKHSSSLHVLTELPSTGMDCASSAPTSTTEQTA